MPECENRLSRFGKALPLAALCLCVAALSACGKSEQIEREMPVRPAKLIEITGSTNLRAMSFPAVIEATASSELTFEVGGNLNELLVREGEEIAKGAVIARLDQRSYLNEVAAAQSQFDNANDEFQRAERLIAENAIARNVFEQRMSQRDVAQSALNTTRRALDNTVIRSPFSGIVAQIHTEQFQNVQPLQPIITLQTTGAAEAQVNIPASLIANSGRINPLSTEVTLDALPGVRIPATFATASTQADPATQTFAVSFAFTPPEDLVILPGMTGSVMSQLELADSEGSTTQITVPVSAIMSDGEANYVWLVDTATMNVSRQLVEIGAGISEDIAIMDGLQVGDTIVGAGASYLHEGMTIRPYEQ